jgi:hypothetical protein
VLWRELQRPQQGVLRVGVAPFVERHPAAQDPQQERRRQPRDRVGQQSAGAREVPPRDARASPKGGGRLPAAGPEGLQRRGPPLQLGPPALSQQGLAEAGVRREEGRLVLERPGPLGLRLGQSAGLEVQGG